MKQFIPLFVLLIGCSKEKTIEEIIPLTTYEQAVKELENLDMPVAWHHILQRGKIIRVTLTEEDLFVEAQSELNLLICIDRINGVKRWVYELPAPLPWAPVAPSPTISSELVAFEAQFEEVMKEKFKEEEKQPPDPEKIQKLGIELNNIEKDYKFARTLDNVYFVSRGSLYCIDRLGGRLVWEKRLKFVPSARPFAIRDHIFIAGSDQSRVWALSVPKQGDDTTFFSPSLEDENQIFNQPIFEDKILIFVAHDRRVHAFEFTMGKKLWEKELGILKCDPVVHRYRTTLQGGGALEYRLVMIGGVDRYFYALDLGSGSIMWKYFTEVTIKSTPACKDDTIYIRLDDGNLLAFETIPIDSNYPSNVGKVRYKLPRTQRFLVKGIKQTHFLADGHKILLVKEPAGKILNTFQLNKIKYVLTNTYDNILYAATEDGVILAMEDTSLKELRKLLKNLGGEDKKELRDKIKEQIIIMVQQHSKLQLDTAPLIALIKRTLTETAELEVRTKLMEILKALNADQ